MSQESRGELALDESFALHRLGGAAPFYVGSLPAALLPDEARFEAIWSLRPEKPHKIVMYGREVDTPRFQQAYGQDYKFSNSISLSRPIPSELLPFLCWVRASIDSRVNSALLNWYEGARRHFIGPHRDSRAGLIEGSSIITLSLGEERIFRLRPWKQPGKIDFPARNGTVFVLPYETNLSWTHEVPAPKRSLGRRISLTFRSFHEGDGLADSKR